jgi:2-polyprenyl-3-methyl-5-hydroxy-6-metoxy-1,4-benzoquinol methylase
MNKIHCPELDSLFNWDKLYSISPKDIKWGLSTGSWFSLSREEWYKVWDGDWDEKLAIEEDFVYSSITNLLNKKMPFEKTDLYLFSIEQILNGNPRWGCFTEEEFKQREQHILDIYKNIKKYGFKTQEELKELDIFALSINDKLPDDPGVLIDRDGRLLYHNGNHRLPMFKNLNIPEIKIRVNGRHKEWAEFLQFVDKVSTKIWGKDKIYQPVNHVDFSHYKSEWSDYRFKLINKERNKNHKTLLDIGALWGYFSSQFEKEGLSCTAVENYPDFIYIIKKLRTAYDQTFTIFDKHLFELKEFKHDIVLALNIFHHFLKTKDTTEKLIFFLQKLKMKEMYFQAHNPSEPQMKTAFVNFDGDTFVKFILKNCCLNHYKKIGEELGRPIYKLWKE